MMDARVLLGFAMVALIAVVAAQDDYTAKIYDVTDLRVSDFGDFGESDVGVCFSGGGSRAMLSAWGQMRALNKLGLLGKFKALSSVSGGSWGTAPFTYNKDIDDDTLLGPLVEDPSKLTVTGLFNGDDDTVLDKISDKTIGYAPTQFAMGPVGMLARITHLLAEGIPGHSLWNRLIGENILAPFGLASFDGKNPADFFTIDKARADRLRATNPDLPSTYYTVKKTGTKRPFHIINMAMFVKADNQVSQDFKYLIPVQSTPFFTGIVSSPDAMTTTQVSVGGTHAVETFAFDSELVGLPNKNEVEVKSAAPFALSDAVGTSSSFFAGIIANKLKDKTVKINPQFEVWFPSQGVGSTSRVDFADGGIIENSGLAAMLTYNDVKKMVVFVNTYVKLEEVDGQIKIGSTAAALFGKFWQDGAGWQDFPELGQGGNAKRDSTWQLRFNKVLDPSRFTEFLEGLKAASTNNGRDPLYTRPCVFKQKGIKVLRNDWWNVKGNREVDILWSYNSRSSDFHDQLKNTVKLETPKSFPWISTMENGYSKTHANLLGHYQAWSVMQNKDLFKSMFDDGAFLAEGIDTAATNSAVGTGVAMAFAVFGAIGVVVGLGILFRRRQARSAGLGHTELV